LTITDLINRQRSEIARALPKHMDADRLARMALTTLKSTPGLLECTQSSLLGALMLSAQTGLEPGPMGHVYLVPRKIKGTKECQWMLGYKGIIELARRSGQLLSIEAREVCELDEFTYSYGLDEVLVHKPYMGGDRGPIVAAWGLAKFKDGGHYFVVLSRSDIDAAKGRSDSAKQGYGPWITDYAAMARKTVIRRMAPYLPLSAEQANAIAQDETVHTSIDEDMTSRPVEGGWIDAEVIEPTPLAVVPPADENGEPIEGGPDEGPADGGSVAGVEPGRDDESAPALPDDPMTDAQSKAVHALLRSKLEAIGPGRFPHLSRILGREITSTKQLSKDEAGQVIEHLQALGEDVGGDDAA
jgi:recombination protein RecT